MKVSPFRVLAIAAALVASPLVSFSQTSNLANPFGVMPAKAWDNHTTVSVPPTSKLVALRNLGVPYLRHAFDHVDVNGSGGANWTNYQTYSNASAKILLNVNWQGGPGSVFPTGTNLTTFTNTLNTILDNIQTASPALVSPTVLVIENEETNQTYYDIDTVSRLDYLNQLDAAITAAHNHGVPITNAGLLELPMYLYTWYHYYYVEGDATKAQAFANLALPNAFTTYPTLKNTTSAPRQKQLDMMRLLIDGEDPSGTKVHDGFKDLALDYVNIHWYLDDPETDINKALGILQDCYDVLAAVTGKIIICNELGARTAGETDPLPTDSFSPGHAVGHIMDFFHSTLKMPYIIWYSGPGDTLFPVALTDKNGVLTSYGDDYRAYITAKFDNVFTTPYWSGTTAAAPLVLSSSSPPTSVVAASGSFTATINSGAKQKWLYEWFRAGLATPINTPTATASLTGSSGTVSTTGKYYAYVTNPAGAVTTGDVFLWNAVKIGGDSSTTAGNPIAGTYTVYGKGGALTGTTDVCQFVEQSVTAPATIIAKLAYTAGTQPSSARAGLMIRAGTGATAPYLLIGNTPVQARLQYRSTTGGATTTVNGGSLATWVKLEWDGTNIKGFFSTASGSTVPTSWTQLGTTQTFSVPTPVMGMTVNGGTAAEATATFSNVILE